MPDPERRRSRVATCEDWDEDAQTTLPGSRTTANANVSIKRSEQDLAAGRMEIKGKMNGVDSGYASRADTIVSEPTSVRRRTYESKNDPPAGIVERERQPYSMAQSTPQAPPPSTPVKPIVRRQPSSRPKDTHVPEPQPSKTPQVHPSGTCQVCDRFGWHDPREISRITATAPQQPPSPVAVRAVAVGRSKDDDVLLAKTKRSSSMRQPRPLSVVTNPSNPPQFVQPAMYATPVFAATPAWSTPATPIYAQQLPAYTYAPPPAPTPGPTQYAPYPPPAHAYFDQVSIPEPRSLQASRKSSPTRRSAHYGEPVINQGHNNSYAVLDRVPSWENRPAAVSHKSQRSIDQDRMPPPPKPQSQDPSLSRRPSNRRSKTYIQEDLPRQRPAQESSRDEREYEIMPPTTAHRSRRESGTLPPSSYRGPAVVDSRPMLGRKTVSYSTAEATMKVASSKTSSHRRTTLPSMTLEQKEAEAEAYQRKRSSATHHLTPEALRNLEKGSAGSRSETGSSYSHKSQQSSSKDSSRGRSQTHSSAAATNINFGGLSVNIPANFKSERPVSINFGDVTLTMNKPQDKPLDRPREQKRIERAPSVTSKTSKKSIASSNVSSTDAPKKTSRRISQLEERPKLSRQHSRAPSATGVTYEYTTVRKQSVDPTKYEDYYGA
ncbi:hypothetical protein LTR84_003769 [Exophiala bonariae]|uniref:Uncharacterized protein n=1 Tax=Exophiala bonariae TaxID=1690606 RepID=A0AAV9NA59_9EURO|nr:hypothetical protein LTR84_003769 [Exophiala bonariae]